jgi:hypothetical protein
MISKALFTILSIVFVFLTVASGFSLAADWDRVDHTIIYILVPFVLVCDYLVIKMTVHTYKYD